ncbi:MAG: SRPBCC domain-containing protein [Longimicrobiales bacterium]
MSEERIEAEVEIQAPTEAVWEAWADPDRLTGWYVDDALGRIGQTDQVTWIWGQMGLEIEYDVVELEPGRRFVLREADEGVRRTEVELTPENGGTRVRVVESGFDTDADAVLSGWTMALGLLKVYVEVYYGGEVRSVLVLGKVDAPPGEIVALQRTAEGLQKWLGAAGAMPAEGEPVRLELEEDAVLDGEVLRRTETETSLTWPLIRGVLEMKQFPTSEGRAAALRAFTWADPKELDLEELQELLSRTLGRFMDALD